MSGLGVISALHQRLPSLPVVVLSALEDPENIRNAISAGAMGFVPKSAQTRVLIEALQQVLEGNVSVPSTLGSAPSLATGGEARGGPERAGHTHVALQHL